MDELSKIFEQTPKQPPVSDPLAHNPYPVWENPLMNIGDDDKDSGSGTKISPQPSDHDDGDAEHDTKQITQVPSTNSEKNIVAPNVDGDDALKAVNFSAKRRYARTLDPNMDPKMLKRIMANRASAQKSRERMIKYVTDKENEVKALEAHVATLHPKIEFHTNEKQSVEMERISLKQQLAAHEARKIIVEAEIEHNKMQVSHLRQLHLIQQQQLLNLQQQAQIPVWENGFTQQMPNQNFTQSMLIEMADWENGAGLEEIWSMDGLEPQETQVNPNSNFADEFEQILSDNHPMERNGFI